MYESITNRVKNLETAAGIRRIVFCIITPLYDGRENYEYATPDSAAEAFRKENNLSPADKLIALVKTDARWIGNTDTAADYLDNTPPRGYAVSTI